MCCDNHFLGRMGRPMHVARLAAITPTTTARTIDLPLTTGVYEVPCAFHETGGVSIIEEFHLIEKVAAPADVRQAALRVVFFRQQPDAPVLATPYEPDLAKYAGEILIKAGVAVPETPKQGYRRISSTKSEAIVADPFTVDADPSLSSLWFVVLAVDAVTYAPSSELTPIVVLSRHR